MNSLFRVFFGCICGLVSANAYAVAVDRRDLPSGTICILTTGGLDCREKPPGTRRWLCQDTVCEEVLPLLVPPRSRTTPAPADSGKPPASMIKERP